MKRTKRGVPEGLWIRCPGCKASIYRKEAEKPQPDDVTLARSLYAKFVGV